MHGRFHWLMHRPARAQPEPLMLHSPTLRQEGLGEAHASANIPLRGLMAVLAARAERPDRLAVADVDQL